MVYAHKEYMDTVRRLEPDIHSIDAGAGYASIAISLKRIADALEARLPPAQPSPPATPEKSYDYVVGKAYKAYYANLHLVSEGYSLFSPALTGEWLWRRERP